MNNPLTTSDSYSPVTFEEAPGLKFFVDSIDFERTPESQKLTVRIEHGDGFTDAILTTENTEDIEHLVIQYMEKAREILPDVHLNFAEIAWNSDGEIGLNLSVKLPAHVGILSDEGFKLQELAQVQSENTGNSLSLEFSEYFRGNLFPLKVPVEFQSQTFRAHQQTMWAEMALQGFQKNVRDFQYTKNVREPIREKPTPILRQIMWKVDTPKTREYSAIILLTIVTYIAMVILCAWIESLKR